MAADGLRVHRPRSARVRSRAGWLALLAALCLLAPVTDQPLYDGVGLPDDPYRHVVPPAGAPRTPLPLGATATVALVDGSNPAPVTLATQEQGPQAVVALRPGAVRGDGASASVRVEPQAPPARLAGGEPLGNAYLVRADPPARVVGAPLVQLRVPQDVEQPVALLHAAGDDRGWAALETRRTGHDTWTAELPGPGRVVAVRVVDAAVLGGAGARGGPSPWWAAALLVPLLAAVALLRRTRSRPQAGDGAAAANVTP